jgi:hypothetical protein
MPIWGPNPTPIDTSNGKNSMVERNTGVAQDRRIDFRIGTLPPAL